MKTRAVRVVLYAIAAVTLAVNVVNISRGFRDERETPRPSPLPTAEPAVIEASLPEPAEAEVYTVRLENGYLNLYDGGRTPKMSERFNAELFPPEDIALLHSGAEFDDLESAYAFAENFLE